MQKFLFYAVLWLTSLSLPLDLSAQLTPGVQQEIAGFWVGLLTQNEGGYADRFELTFNLEVRNGKVSGTAFVALDDIHAEMAVEGRLLRNGSWRIRETRIIRKQQPEYLSWCLKGYELQVSMDANGELILMGPWWGNTEYGPCVPGRITLRRPRDRAK